MKITSPDNVSIDFTRQGPELIVTIERPGHSVLKMAFDVKEAVTIRNTIAAMLKGLKAATRAGAPAANLRPLLLPRLLAAPAEPSQTALDSEARFYDLMAREDK